MRQTSTKKSTVLWARIVELHAVTTRMVAAPHRCLHAKWMHMADWTCQLQNGLWLLLFPRETQALQLVHACCTFSTISK